MELPDLSDLLTAAGLPDMEHLIEGVELQHALPLPWVGLDLTAPSNPHAKQETLAELQAMKPKLIVHLGGGLAPIVWAPYGDPGQARWPSAKSAVELGGGLLLGVLGFGVLSAVLPRKRA